MNETETENIDHELVARTVAELGLAQLIQPDTADETITAWVTAAEARAGAPITGLLAELLRLRDVGCADWQAQVNAAGNETAYITEAELHVKQLQARQLAAGAVSLAARRALETARTRAVVAVARELGASVEQLHGLRRGMCDGGWTVELERSGMLLDRLEQWSEEYYGESEDAVYEFEIIAELVWESWADVVIFCDEWARRALT